ncbi:hypothetical protein ACIQLK_09220 [Microbacterium sp. NPDC091382]|uniref:hypothetical protein n=1 Tax=Microbacterium sp. NPDC091382 TaxID=3364210 RepID=UPI00381A6EBB
MTTIAASTDLRLRPYRLVAASDRLWRVVDAAGLVIGHLARNGERFAARRFRASVGGFVQLGEFCRLDDAVAALHDSR